MRAAAALKDRAKAMLTHVGSVFPESCIDSANACLNFLETGRWFAQMNFSLRRRVQTREDVYAEIAANVAGARVLYLEFGVWQGASLRWWSRSLRHPEAMLHAFDRFEGLPEDWNGRWARGAFSTNGIMPQVDDPRVRFFVGWFSDTLPAYEAPPHDVLLVNVDCDLYSSAKTVLTALQPLIRVGTMLYFDEYADRLNEQRAFHEYLTATGQRFQVVAASRNLNNVAFVRVS